MLKTKRPARIYSVEIVFQGKKYEGTYEVKGGMLTVRRGFLEGRQRSAYLGGMSEDFLAKRLLTEMVMGD